MSTTTKTSTRKPRSPKQVDAPKRLETMPGVGTCDKVEVQEPKQPAKLEVGVSEFRRQALLKPQPDRTPEDVLGLAQAMAALTCVEIRVAKPSPTDPAWWVIFIHEPAKRTSVQPMFEAGGFSEARIDGQNRCVWVRPIIASDLPPKPEPAQPKAKATGQTVRRAVGSQGTKPCLCGCGGTTKSTFAMGHDARFYGWLAEFQVTGQCSRANEDPATQEALRTWELPAKKSYLKDRFLLQQASK